MTERAVSFNDSRDVEGVTTWLCDREVLPGVSLAAFVDQGLAFMGRPDVDVRELVTKLVEDMLQGRALVPLEPTEGQVKASKNALYRHIHGFKAEERARRFEKKMHSDGSHTWRVPPDLKVLLRYRAMVRGRPPAGDHP